jgi:hypothetical protein
MKIVPIKQNCSSIIATQISSSLDIYVVCGKCCPHKTKNECMEEYAEKIRKFRQLGRSRSRLENNIKSEHK